MKDPPQAHAFCATSLGAAQSSQKIFQHPNLKILWDHGVSPLFSVVVL